MKPPSRLMSATPIRKTSMRAWLFLVAMLAAFGGWVYQQPYVSLAVLAISIIITGVQMVLDSRRRRRLAASREGESICEFARSFDRQTDTWLIRSVYEELSRLLSVDGRPIPVRRQDRCEKDLGIDSEDLDDVAKDAALRARRSMETCEMNPLYGKVQTVGDLVIFLEYQPRIVEPQK